MRGILVAIEQCMLLTNFVVFPMVREFKAILAWIG